MRFILNLFARSRDKKPRHIYNCPKCDIALIQRVHRAGIIKIFLPWAPLKRYICGNCLHKYHVYVKRPPTKVANITYDNYALLKAYYTIHNKKMD